MSDLEQDRERLEWLMAACNDGRAGQLGVTNFWSRECIDWHRTNQKLPDVAPKRKERLQEAAFHTAKLTLAFDHLLRADEFSETEIKSWIQYLIDEGPRALLVVEATIAQENP